MSLLSQHYRNCFELDEEEKIDKNIVKDIILAILGEDSGLGLSLILAELMNDRKELLEELASGSKTGPFVLYLSALHTVISEMKGSGEAFKARPALVYAVAKNLSKDYCIMTKALELSDIETE